MSRIWILLAALLGASAVAIGAYHAHGLEDRLSKKGTMASEVRKKMDFCGTAVNYQMMHALALLGVGILATRSCSFMLHLAAVLLVAGILGFSGGLYCSVFEFAKLHWAVIPLGGLLMILGWLALAVAQLLPPYTNNCPPK